MWVTFRVVCGSVLKYLKYKAGIFHCLIIWLMFAIPSFLLSKNMNFTLIYLSTAALSVAAGFLLIQKIDVKAKYAYRIKCLVMGLCNTDAKASVGFLIVALFLLFSFGFLGRLLLLIGYEPGAKLNPIYTMYYLFVVSIITSKKC